VRTLAHQIGHVRADHETRFLDRYHGSPACRGVTEVEAESIAYLVTASAGMSTDAYSVPYLTGWSDSDPALLRATAARVIAVAREIIRDLSLGVGPDTASAETLVTRMPPTGLHIDAEPGRWEDGVVPP
jgi:hypothetical protein